MSLAALSFVIAGLGLVGWLSGRMRAARFRRDPGAGFNALPAHHAAYVMLWTVAPAALFVGIWATTSPALVTADVLRSAAARGLPEAGFERAAILSEARSIATRDGFGREGFGREGFGREGFGARTTGGSTGDLDPRSATLAPAYADAQSRYDTIASGAAVLLAFSAGALAYLRVRPQFRARRRVETVIMAALLCASLIAILATLGIVASLLFETLRFFRLVPLSDFLLGTHWSPQSITRLDPGAVLGAVPLFWGTFFIGAIIAMAVAVPLGLMTAIYLTQYARPAVRRALKPSIEILAGVPTVVYGYFAALTVAPAVRDLGVALHLPGASSESALAAGLVIGVMIIPFVSSMADDSIAAVPASMRDGSLAMGATLAETIRRVLLPAALPGVVGGILLAVSRAIGETMIVVMAASGVATLSLNPFASATTVTKQIVDLLTGEAAFDSPKTLAAFALGLTLFAVTLLLNIVALIVVKRYREAYD